MILNAATTGWLSPPRPAVNRYDAPVSHHPAGERDEEVIIDRAGTPVAKIIPYARRVNRTSVGSLASHFDLSGDWDSPSTNAEIAADFGISS